jgi:hypothetical protein
VAVVTTDHLSRSHGYLVIATDGPCGAVETPVFPPDGGEPDYIVVRTGGRVRPRYPIVAAAVVGAVDTRRELVFLDLDRAALGRMPEHLPLAI